MKSPFTGGDAELRKEKRTMDFRKEPFEVMYHFYVCKDSGEQFTTDELDEVNTNQVYNQYRTKYGIPFPDEIKAVREQYGLPASKMAEVLGLGINVYRNYEAGEVPSVSNGRLIQLIKDPKEFRSLIDLSRNEFTEDELNKINKKINATLEGFDVLQHFYEERMLGERRPNIFNGYKTPNLEKIINMVIFFAERIMPFKTKMNKLLFYADFQHFKTSCYSISGITYQAIQKGPVPKNYDWIFDEALNKRCISIKLVDYGEFMGEKFEATGKCKVDESLFTKAELNAMEIVAAAFKSDTVNSIVNKSHTEDAWKDNIDDFGAIRYDYAFNLNYPQSN